MWVDKSHDYVGQEFFLIFFFVRLIAFNNCFRSVLRLQLISELSVGDACARKIRRRRETETNFNGFLRDKRRQVLFWIRATACSKLDR